MCVKKYVPKSFSMGLSLRTMAYQVLALFRSQSGDLLNAKLTWQIQLKQHQEVCIVWLLASVPTKNLFVYLENIQLNSLTNSLLFQRTHSHRKDWRGLDNGWLVPFSPSSSSALTMPSASTFTSLPSLSSRSLMRNTTVKKRSLGKLKNKWQQKLLRKKKLTSGVRLGSSLGLKKDKTKANLWKI